MACHADRGPAAKPETVFEPVNDGVADAGDESARRGVNLASHTGVGIAGAAGVLGAQRVLGSEDVSDDGGQALDVFHPVVEAPPDEQPRGISASASPVAEPVEQAEPLEETAPFVFTSAEPVEFLPPADESAPEDLATIPEAAGSEPLGAPVEQERGTSLASAEAEIGGGVSVDQEGHELNTAFGATSEIGMLDSEDLTADDDEDDLASTP